MFYDNEDDVNVTTNLSVFFKQLPKNNINFSRDNYVTESSDYSEEFKIITDEFNIFIGKYLITLKWGISIVDTFEYVSFMRHINSV